MEQALHFAKCYSCKTSGVIPWNKSGKESGKNEFAVFYEPILSTEGGRYNSKDEKVHASCLNSPTTPPCWEVKP